MQHAADTSADTKARADEEDALGELRKLAERFDESKDRPWCYMTQRVRRKHLMSKCTIPGASGAVTHIQKDCSIDFQDFSCCFRCWKPQKWSEYHPSNRCTNLMFKDVVCTVMITAVHLTPASVKKLGFKGDPGICDQAVFGPDGKPLAEPIGDGEEGIITAVVNLRDIDKPKAFIHVIGHYVRPDLLSLKVNQEVAKHVVVD